MLHGIIILFFFSSSLALVSGRDCSAPPSRQGRCRAAFVRFTYEQGVCREFTYGGCGASDNLFVTLEECQAFCSGIRAQPGSLPASNRIPDLPVVASDQRCSATPFLYGGCSQQLSRWSFYPVTGSCHRYIYSGCSEGLAQNRFSLLQNCVQTCLK